MSYEIEDEFSVPGDISYTLENYWVRETAYIVNEMLHAIRESKNPECSEKQRGGYARRAKYLNQKAIFCINSAYNDSNNEEEKQ